MIIRASMEMVGIDQWTDAAGYGQDERRAVSFEVQFDDDVSQGSMIASVLDRLLDSLRVVRKTAIVAEIAGHCSQDAEDGNIPEELAFLDAAENVLCMWEQNDKGLRAAAKNSVD